MTEINSSKACAANCAVLPKESDGRNRLAGMITFCCQDTEFCRACGHARQFGTKWGLFRPDGTPEPAYDAVREIITAAK